MIDINLSPIGLRRINHNYYKHNRDCFISTIRVKCKCRSAATVCDTAVQSQKAVTAYFQVSTYCHSKLKVEYWELVLFVPPGSRSLRVCHVLDRQPMIIYPIGNTNHNDTSPSPKSRRFQCPLFYHSICMSFGETIVKYLNSERYHKCK